MVTVRRERVAKAVDEFMGGGVGVGTTQASGGGRKGLAGASAAGY